MVEQLSEAGRALDLWIAEHVMGWRWVGGDNPDVTTVERPLWLLPPDMRPADVRPGEWDYVDRERAPNRLTLFDVPCFSTDITAAWTVVERLHLLVSPTITGGWCAGEFLGVTGKGHDGGQRYCVPGTWAEAATAPLAICRSASRIAELFH